MKLEVMIAKDHANIAACMKLRRIVFIEEQNVTEDEEVDGEDEKCIHFLATLDGNAVGAARLQCGETYAKIQRVCVLKEQRGKAIGFNVIEFIIKYVSNNQLSQSIRLGAQTQALGFYTRLGFVEFGDEYLDAGIWHKDMELQLSE